MNKQSTYVMNRLKDLEKLTNKFRIKFRFVEGICNPADYVTRPVSMKVLSKSNYISGPKIVDGEPENLACADLFNFSVPCIPEGATDSVWRLRCNASSTDASFTPLLDIHKYSSLDKLIGVYQQILRFRDILKVKCGKSADVKVESLKTQALLHIIKFDQQEYFSNIHDYFEFCVS